MTEHLYKLSVEVNTISVKDPSEDRIIMITPHIDEYYWLARVKLFADQSIIAFPKFGTIGIGFAIEEDWNTNLPYCKSSAEEICNHIWHNRRYVAIRKKRTIRAIKMLMDYIRKNIKK